MKENEDITGMFRSRLGDVGMEVREGFWEELQSDPAFGAVPSAVSDKRPFLFPLLPRVAAAVAGICVLGAASAAFWYFSPKEQLEEAFTQAAVLAPEGGLTGDIVQESFPSIHQAGQTGMNPGGTLPVASSLSDSEEEEEGEELLSLRLSITVRKQTYAKAPVRSMYYDVAQGWKNYSAANGVQPASSAEQTGSGREAASPWAWKVGVGTALPKDGCHAPFAARLSVERELGKYLSLETGVEYDYLPMDKKAGKNLHLLSVPVKLNLLLAESAKAALYATVGAAAEKSVNCGFQEDPVRLSVSAGVGVRYQVNERFALFAEPSVSKYMHTDTSVHSLRSERPVNMNLLCGVRMTY